MTNRNTAATSSRQRLLLGCVSAAALLTALTSVPLMGWAASSQPTINLNPASTAPAMNDYLEHGLLQTPSARTGDAGSILVGGSFVYPYIVFGTTISLTPWFEAGLRYTKVQDHLYGPESFSGNQTYLDRAFSFKLRLLDETAGHPAVAVGVRDFVGTGLFSSEYLVASRRWYDIDVSAGIGWGQLGQQFTFTNPLSHFHQFANRDSGTTAGGFGHLPFSGQTAGLFGGFEWHTPVDGLSFVAELDGNRYETQPFGYDPHAKSPVNIGLHYRPVDGIDLGGGFERGNALMGRVAFEFDVGRPIGAEKPDPDIAAAPIPFVRQPAVLDAPPLAAADGALDPTTAPGWISTNSGTLPALLDQLRPIALTQGYDVIAVNDVGGERRILIEPITNGKVDNLDANEALGQFARRAATMGPHRVGRIVLTIRKPDSSRERQLALPVDSLEQSVALTGLTADAVKAAVTRDAKVLPAVADRDMATATALLIFADLKAANMRGEAFEIRGDEAILQFSQESVRYVPAALGPAARIMAARVPANVQTLTLVLVNHNARLLRISLPRRDIEALAARRISPEELWINTRVAPATALDPARRVANDKLYPGLSWSLLPRLQQQLGGPDGFLLFELYANLSGEVALAPGWDVGGALDADLYDNFDQLKLQSDSVLPHVRSDIAKYLKQGKYGIGRLYTDYIVNIAPEWYGRLSGGLLETMFAGVDGEVLWRPYNKRFAIGLDMASVAQRGYDELVDMRSYRVTTGQATFYYRWPVWGLTTKLSVGRYLAGDKGATFDISREFDSGIRIGAFATKTNVSAAEFGEGSFDKGVYLSIPLDIFSSKSSTSTAGFTFRPLTRDGGQMLTINKPLYSLTDGASAEQLWEKWPQIGN